jgi:hypothetical protein
MVKSSIRYKLLFVFLLMICLFFSGCECEENTANNEVNPNPKPAVGKELMIEGPLPDIAAGGSITFAPSNINRSVEFSSRYIIIVVDRDEPSQTREIAPVLLKGNKFTVTIPLSEFRINPLIIVKEKETSKNLYLAAPGRVPAYGEVPDAVRRIIIRGLVVDSKSTARSLLAIAKNVNPDLPILNITKEEETSENIIREIKANETTRFDAIIDNNVGGAAVVTEFSRAVQTVTTILSSTAIGNSIKTEINVKLGVRPDASAILTAYVSVIKSDDNDVINVINSSELPRSIKLSETIIDARTSDNAVGEVLKNTIDEPVDAVPPEVDFVSISPSSLRPRETVYIDFRSNEPLISPPAVWIKGRLAAVIGVNDLSFTAVQIIDENDTGAVSFVIDEICDRYGNKGSSVSTTTDGSVALINKTAVTGAPLISPAGGRYDSTLSVSIASPAISAVIKYTLDGTLPSPENGIVYVSPVTIFESSVLKAAVFIDNNIASGVSSAAYIIAIAKPVTVTPVFDPPGSTYYSTQSVTLSTPTEGAIIRYTLDGTKPDKTNGVIYDRPFTVASSMKALAVAYKDGMRLSDLAVAVYTIETLTEKAEKPVATLPSGTYDSTQSVALTSSTPGVKIYYTIDGTIPTICNSLVCNGPLELIKSCVLKAVAAKNGMLDSDMLSVEYIINVPLPRVASPSITPASGTFENSITVEISTATKGASIYYTIDGGTPSALNGIRYSGPFSIDKTVTVKAVSIKSDMLDSEIASETYTSLKAVGAPVFSLKDGQYKGTQSVVLTSPTEGALIYYTRNGAIPTKTAGTLYSGTLEIAASVIIKAIAIRDGMTDSSATEARFTIIPPDPKPERVATPLFNPAGGITSASTQQVEITCATEGALIYYTVNGAAPDKNSLKYSGPVVIIATTAIKAIAFKDGMLDSEIAESNYPVLWPVSVPTLSVVSGSYENTVEVMLSCVTPGAKIYYTLDGSVPTAATGVLYAVPVPVLKPLTIKAIAVKEAMADSTVVEAGYVVPTEMVSTPVITPNGGNFYTQASVSIACATSGAEIYYTLDGSAPSRLSLKYTAPFVLNKFGLTSVKAVAYTPGMFDSMTAASNSFNVMPLILPPTFASASTNAAGTKIMVAFSKVMKTEGLAAGDFAVDVNAGTPDVVTAVSLNADEKIVELTLADVLVYGQNITVSYTKGEAKSSDGLSLESFSAKPVSNTVPSTDATLKANTAKIKGQAVADLGAPAASIAGAAAGTVSITPERAADTSNTGNFITVFEKNVPVSTLKTVKYAKGSSTANFETDAAYNNETITSEDFFIVKVMAQDAVTVKYYKVSVYVVLPLPEGVYTISGAASNTDASIHFNGVDTIKVGIGGTSQTTHTIANTKYFDKLSAVIGANGTGAGKLWTGDKITIIGGEIAAVEITGTDITADRSLALGTNVKTNASLTVAGDTNSTHNLAVTGIASGAIVIKGGLVNISDAGLTGAVTANTSVSVITSGVKNVTVGFGGVEVAATGGVVTVNSGLTAKINGVSVTPAGANAPFTVSDANTLTVSSEASGVTGLTLVHNTAAMNKMFAFGSNLAANCAITLTGPAAANTLTVTGTSTGAIIVKGGLVDVSTASLGGSIAAGTAGSTITAGTKAVVTTGAFTFNVTGTGLVTVGNGGSAVIKGVTLTGSASGTDTIQNTSNNDIAVRGGAVLIASDAAAGKVTVSGAAPSTITNVKENLEIDVAAFNGVSINVSAATTVKVGGLAASNTVGITPAGGARALTFKIADGVTPSIDGQRAIDGTNRFSYSANVGTVAGAASGSFTVTHDAAFTLAKKSVIPDGMYVVSASATIDANKIHNNGSGTITIGTGSSQQEYTGLTLDNFSNINKVVGTDGAIADNKLGTGDKITLAGGIITAVEIVEMPMESSRVVVLDTFIKSNSPIVATSDTHSANPLQINATTSGPITVKGGSVRVSDFHMTGPITAISAASRIQSGTKNVAVEVAGVEIVADGGTVTVNSGLTAKINDLSVTASGANVPLAVTDANTLTVASVSSGVTGFAVVHSTAAANKTIVLGTNLAANCALALTGPAATNTLTVTGTSSGAVTVKGGLVNVSDANLTGVIAADTANSTINAGSKAVNTTGAFTFNITGTGLVTAGSSGTVVVKGITLISAANTDTIQNVSGNDVAVRGGAVTIASDAEAAKLSLVGAAPSAITNAKAGFEINVAAFSAVPISVSAGTTVATTGLAASNTVNITPTGGSRTVALKIASGVTPDITGQVASDNINGFTYTASAGTVGGAAAGFFTVSHSEAFTVVLAALDPIPDGIYTISAAAVNTDKMIHNDGAGNIKIGTGSAQTAHTVSNTRSFSKYAAVIGANGVGAGKLWAGDKLTVTNGEMTAVEIAGIDISSDRTVTLGTSVKSTAALTITGDMNNTNNTAVTGTASGAIEIKGGKVDVSDAGLTGAITMNTIASAVITSGSKNLTIGANAGDNAVTVVATGGTISFDQAATNVSINGMKVVPSVSTAVTINDGNKISVSGSAATYSIEADSASALKTFNFTSSQSGAISVKSNETTNGLSVTADAGSGATVTVTGGKVNLEDTDFTGTFNVNAASNVKIITSAGKNLSSVHGLNAVEIVGANNVTVDGNLSVLSIAGMNQLLVGGDISTLNISAGSTINQINLNNTLTTLNAGGAGVTIAALTLGATGSITNALATVGNLTITAIDQSGVAADRAINLGNMTTAVSSIKGHSANKLTLSCAALGTCTINGGNVDITGATATAFNINAMASTSVTAAGKNVIVGNHDVNTIGIISAANISITGSGSGKVSVSSASGNLTINHSNAVVDILGNIGGTLTLTDCANVAIASIAADPATITGAVTVATDKTLVVEQNTTFTAAATVNGKVNIVSGKTLTLTAADNKFVQQSTITGALAGVTNDTTTAQFMAAPTGAGAATDTGNFYQSDNSTKEAAGIKTYKWNTTGGHWNAFVSTGTGTSEDPFKIYKIDDLAKVGSGTDGWASDKCYILMNDLNFGDNASYTNTALKTTYTTGTGWTPICAYGTHDFKGNFNGNNHTISNLYINRNEQFQGLFASVGADGAPIAVIKNLTISGAGITTTSSTAGVLSSSIYRAVIDNCHIISPTISADQGFVGSLAGSFGDTIVKNCSATLVNISCSGGGYAGGLIGDMGMYAAIQNQVSSCFVSGTVNAGGNSTCNGGLIGSTGDMVINGCYSTVNVTGATFTGGLIGQLQSGCTVKNCYATGTVNSTHFSGRSYWKWFWR